MNAGGGIELGRSRSKRPTVNRGLREGNDGMASHGEAPVNLRYGLGARIRVHAP